jgi:hypothetical protein
MKIQWLRSGAQFVVLIAVTTCASSGFAQSKVEKPAAQIDELQRANRILRADYDALKAEYGKLAGVVEEINRRVGDSGWKALDATTKLSSLQWQTLAFVLALLVAGSFGGWQGYKLLRDKLEGEIRASMRSYETILRHSTGAFAFGQISMGFWSQYGAIPAQPSTEQEKERLLGAAILMSSFALDEAERLEALGDEKYVELITNVKANHAYWLAEQPNPNDRSKANPKNADAALKLAKQAFAVASAHMKADGTKSITKWPDWIESYCFVTTRFGTQEDKDAAKELIRALCTDVRVNPTWRSQIRKEYGVEPA